MHIITCKNPFVNRSLSEKQSNKNFHKFIIKHGEKSLTNKKEKYIIVNVCGDMAQLVERLVRNEEASGSNPLISTKNDLIRTTRIRSFLFKPKVLICNRRRRM